MGALQQRDQFKRTAAGGVLGQRPLAPGASHLRQLLIAETEDELRRQREAELRRANRLAERDQLLAGREPPSA